MTASRNDQDWSRLLSEYNICKKKLQSKREGLQILVKQLEQTQLEKDILNNKVIQLQSELDGFKQLLGKNWVHSEDGSKLNVDSKEDSTKIKTLNNLLQFSRQEKQEIQNDFNNLKQLYNESQRDNQLLRTTLSKYEVRKKIGINEKQGKEHLITQLEEANSKIEILEEELQMRKDDKKELMEEKDLLQKKNTRLNSELNYVLHNDDKRIVDIDNLLLENKYLKEVVKQYKEEKSVALNVASRYKEAMQKTQPPNNKHLSYYDLNSSNDAGHDGLFTKSFNHKMVLDLQRVNKLLTEKVAEKETALKHQRNTNRVLGTRVSELEKKLKTLEISGLWFHEPRIPRNLREGDLQVTGKVDDKEVEEACVSPDDSETYLHNEPLSKREIAGEASEGILIGTIDDVSVSDENIPLGSVEGGNSLTNGYPCADQLLSNDECLNGDVSTESVHLHAV